jgi:ABC-type polysaccharide/polyol phosphate export permease
MTDLDLREQTAVRPPEVRPLELPAVRTITPVKRRLRFADVFRDISVVRVLAARDFKVKYKQSLLGPIWLVVQPLTMLAGFTIVFGSVAKVDTQGIPYALFAVVGITVWTTFQTSVLYGTRCIVANKGIVNAMPVPRLSFVSGTLLGNVPQFLFMVVVTLIAVPVAGRGFGPQLLLLPLCALWLFALLYGVILPLAAWHTRYRDIGSVVPFLFQAGLFLSPIAYPLSQVPAGLRTIMELNPISGVVEAWRYAVLASEPSMLAIAAGLGWTALLLVVGWTVFSHAEVKFADVV